jgi:MtN3 and saliva related transmembrane protein
MLNLVGAAAGVLTTGAWLPQILHCWRTRSVRDVSWGYMLVLAVGAALWVVYGACTSDAILVLANAATLVALATLVVFKFAFSARMVTSGDAGNGLGSASGGSGRAGGG